MWKWLSHPIWLHRYRFESCPDYKKIIEMENYIGLILDERNDHYTIGYRQTSDLQKLKEWKKEMLECSNITDCKILKVEEIE